VQKNTERHLKFGLESLWSGEMYTSNPTHLFVRVTPAVACILIFNGVLIWYVHLGAAT
jgi:hypothetical protein